MTQVLQEVKKSQSPIVEYINTDKFKKELSKVLGNAMNPERMARIALTELRLNPKLRQCDPYSFGSAILQCCEVRLEPGSIKGLIYLVPYGKEVKAITSYKGLVQLALRSNKIHAIYANPVYEKDVFDISFGSNAKLVHVPSLLERGKTYAYYSYVKFTNGGEQFLVLSQSDIIKTMKKSPTSQSGPWQTYYDEMACKTAIRRLDKYLPEDCNDLNTALQNEQISEQGITIEGEGSIVPENINDDSNYQSMEVTSSKTDELLERLG